MKRLIVSLAVLCITGATMNAATAKPATYWRSHECRYQGLDGKKGFSAWEVQVTIHCAAAKFGVNVGTALYIADRESSFFAHALNPYSGACGVFQHIPRYFAARLAAVPKRFQWEAPSCMNARSNILAALWMARYGWGPWSL
jgi:hypothetical protein